MPLTGADLQRLVSGTGRPPGDLVEWLEPDAVDMTGEPETFVRLPQGRRLMVLAWTGGGCQHLEGNLCSVYLHRPASCRAYPFHAQLGKRNGIHRLQLLDTTDCQHTWGAATPAREVSNAALQQRRELGAYALRVQAFNRVQGRFARLGRPLLDVGVFFERGLKLAPAVPKPAPP